MYHRILLAFGALWNHSDAFFQANIDHKDGVKEYNNARIVQNYA